jgi:hypothetical protein
MGTLASAADHPHAKPTSPLSEVAISRAAVPEPGLMFREFDLPGSKSEFVLGTSVQGSPDLILPRLGLFQPVSRLPQKASGLYSSALIWDPWTIGMNGENGLLREKSSMIASLDTPQIILDWQRSAFTGNSLRLDFQRSLVDSLFLDFGMVTHSTDSSGIFRYQDITHQPYLGTLKRDSSSVPLSGRNLAFDTFIMQPRLLWKTQNGSVGVSSTWFRLRNDDATRQNPIVDSLNPAQLNFADAPFTLRTRLNSLGAEATYRKFGGSITWWHQRTSLENIWINTPSTIQDSVDTLVNDQYLSQIQSGQVTLSLPWQEVQAILQYESRTHALLWEDRELGYLQYADSFFTPSASWNTRAQLGMQRNSSTFDKVFYEPAFSLEANALFRDHFGLEAQVRRHQRFADAEETRHDELGRQVFSNPNLRTEERRTGQVALSYHAPAFSYGLGLRRESSKNAIAMGWLAHPTESVLPDSLAFRLVNMDSIGNLSWRCFGGFHLGNWDFWMEREASLQRWLALEDGTYSRSVPSSPTHTYKGTVVWSKLLVNEKLKVDIRWDFQWLGDREDYYLTPEGLATRETLPKNLLLNFEARMKINTFSLYTRLENLNHTKLTLGSGYAPPGVTFRYGILWELFG